jgi:hypothetical protein
MLATEDMFLYEQLPNFETNVPALEKLFRSVINVPGIKSIQTSHITMAPVVKEPFHHRTADAFGGSLFARATQVFYRPG